MPPLLPDQRRLRAAGGVALLAGGGMLWMFAPWLVTLVPKCVFHAATGLPCAFCGTTRAVSAAAGGDWSRALELNAFGIGVLVSGAALLLVLGTEALRGRALLDWAASRRRFARLLPLVVPLLALWWVVHLVDAIRTPKIGLVDLSNPVAGVVAGWFGVKSGSEGGAQRD